MFLPNRFNSLQTGKRIASNATSLNLHIPESVSIPFKRESGSQVWRPYVVLTEVDVFQFPSNGKADRKSFFMCSLRTPNSVSIPFKRESGSQAATTTSLFGTVSLFQFPSNGNADRKFSLQNMDIFCNFCFNSLQTGTRIASSVITGKERIKPLVSIPFKRERGSQVENVKDALSNEEFSVFQFPSNGKAERKIAVALTLTVGIGFNSLQTGKRIARERAESNQP